MGPIGGGLLGSLANTPYLEHQRLYEEIARQQNYAAQVAMLNAYSGEAYPAREAGSAVLLLLPKKGA
jgi:hypothetical protein